MGLFEDASYDVGTVTVPNDGTILIYTDGVVEARNPDDEELGLARLIEVCARRHEGLGALLSAVMDTVRDWSKDSRARGRHHAAGVGCRERVSQDRSEDH